MNAEIDRHYEIQTKILFRGLGEGGGVIVETNIAQNFVFQRIINSSHVLSLLI